MAQLAALRPQARRFFDAGDDSGGASHADARYEFVWDISSGRERFQMLRRVGYEARAGNGAASGTFIVPKDLRSWRTDFASVPPVFSWLVPRSGAHVPAAVLHDALVEGPSSYIGPPVSRDEADRVFKDAMADLGIGVVRRWLMWTAVTLATIWLRQVGSRLRWYYFGIALVTLVVILVCGGRATLDLLDWAEDWPELPWMTGGTLWSDIWRGAAGAVVIPMLVSGLWGRFWRAGAIAGVALALLLHVTAVIAALTLLYAALERLGRRARGRALLVVLVAVGIAAGVLFVLAVT